MRSDVSFPEAPAARSEKNARLLAIDVTVPAQSEPCARSNVAARRESGGRQEEDEDGEERSRRLLRARVSERCGSWKREGNFRVCNGAIEQMEGLERVAALQYWWAAGREAQGRHRGRRLVSNTPDASFITLLMQNVFLCIGLFSHFHMFSSDNGGLRQQRRPFCENGANLNSDSGKTPSK